MAAIQAGWRLWLSLLGTTILGTILSIYVSVRIADQDIRRQYESDCGTLGALIKAYEEVPPSTAAGRNVQRAYIEQYRLHQCADRQIRKK